MALVADSDGPWRSEPSKGLYSCRDTGGGPDSKAGTDPDADSGSKVRLGSTAGSGADAWLDAGSDSTWSGCHESSGADPGTAVPEPAGSSGRGRPRFDSEPVSPTSIGSSAGGRIGEESPVPTGSSARGRISSGLDRSGRGIPESKEPTSPLKGSAPVLPESKGRPVAGAVFHPDRCACSASVFRAFSFAFFPFTDLPLVEFFLPALPFADFLFASLPLADVFFVGVPFLSTGSAADCAFGDFFFVGVALAGLALTDAALTALVFAALPLTGFAFVDPPSCLPSLPDQETDRTLPAVLPTDGRPVAREPRFSATSPVRSPPSETLSSGNLSSGIQATERPCRSNSRSASSPCSQCLAWFFSANSRSVHELREGPRPFRSAPAVR